MYVASCSHAAFIIKNKLTFPYLFIDLLPLTFFPVEGCRNLTRDTILLPRTLAVLRFPVSLRMASKLTVREKRAHSVIS